ncbi:MAG: hypothetical protein ACLSVD_00010 [Eggerthellaceae bacterium]
MGVGVNVLPPDKRPDVGGRIVRYVADLADSVAAPAVAVEAVLEALLAAFAPLYGVWRRNGFAPLVDEFNAYSSLNGQNVRMVDRADNLLAEGAVVGVDAQGRLVLRSESGIETAISSAKRTSCSTLVLSKSPSFSLNLLLDPRHGSGSTVVPAPERRQRNVRKGGEMEQARLSGETFSEERG